MPSSSEIRRIRLRRKDNRRGLRNIASASSVMLAVLVALLSVVGLSVSMAYAELQRGLPAVVEIDRGFATSNGNLLAPTRFYDRTGEVIIAELLHPLASERIWLDLPSESSSDIYQRIVSTTLAAQDASYWSNPGFEWSGVLRLLTADSITNGSEPEKATIAQQVVRYMIQPVGDASIDVRSRYLRSVLLASRLTDEYTKEQILEWYLNSTYYGNLAYGLDAAALVYFGVHASDLSLAQAAMLASIPSSPEFNPVHAPQQARERQLETLQEMMRLGTITEHERQRATHAALAMRGSEEIRADLETSGFNAYAWSQLLDIMGPQFAHRPALQVTTTLDLSLQLQTDCTVRTYLARMRGDNPALILEALDGSDCAAAVSLPPLRPGDVGLDHRINDVSIVIMDPFAGEILSLVDTQGTFSPRNVQVLAADQAHQLGSAFYPFIYLTAFSRGLAPGTMVLDLPLASSTAPGVDTLVDWSDYHGPASMRTALAGSYEAAAERTLELAGVGNVLRTTQQMGVTVTDAQNSGYQQVLSADDAESSLIDLTFAFSLMANNGSMVGVDLTNSEQGSDTNILHPASILLVEDALGNEIFHAEPDVRVVLSPQLAYLMTDVLSDEVVRWDIYGQSNPLEIGRPAGAMIGTTDALNDNWTVGFTPARAVGVWIGNTDESMVGVGSLNGAAPLWHALMDYSTRDLPLQGWSAPPGVSEMDVCDPSGLLPTIYCPTVVSEVFIQGTEPTSYDHLYKPFRVNKETGHLATLFTPLDLIEERVYMVPPPEALHWARQVGIEQPPQEYDSIYVQPEANPAVNITSLEPFMYASGELLIEGNAQPEGFLYYRLQYGAGINPTRWIQLDQDIHEEVKDEVLGVWNTEGLNGLFTLQLVVVREGDRVDTAAVPLTIDNLPPLLQLINPQDEQDFSRSQDQEVIILAEASDETGLSQVAFYIDGRQISVTETPPYAIVWDIVGVGEHTLFARAYDLAGNSTQTEIVTIEIIP